MKTYNSNFLFFLRLAEFASQVIPKNLINAIYRCSFLSHCIRSVLNYYAPTGLTEVSIKSGALSGFRLKLDLKSEKSYWLGTYETLMIQAIHDFVKPGMMVYDIGANIGYLSLVFSQAVGKQGRVYAFEPLLENVKRIHTHIALNSLDEIITVFPYAVFDSNGRQPFLVHELHAMGKLSGSSGRDETYKNQIVVRTLCLNEFIFKEENPPPDLIKIDIEGGAVQALPGMSKVLKKYQPIILMELHGPEEAQITWDLLRQCNYKIYAMKKHYPEISTSNSLNWKEYIVAKPYK
jgi:FkbM family methyltransferase